MGAQAAQDRAMAKIKAETKNLMAVLLRMPPQPHKDRKAAKNKKTKKPSQKKN